jgi:APA family basic amino acid/polyamine antiporter
MTDQPGLARRLGLPSAIAVTVGAVIGSGIFLKPLDVAQSLPDELSIHAAWIALGLVSLLGALAYAELGAMLPEAGGQYAFLREGWGRFVAFLYGWTFMLAINSGTLAALAAAFADQAAALAPLGEGGRLAVAAAMIGVLAAVNHFGVNVGAIVQNASTFAKLAAIAVLIVGGLLVVGGGAEGGAVRPPEARPSGAAIVTGLLAIFWAYEGWYQLPFNAAELKRPERDLPRGLIWGMLILIGAYVLINLAYLRVIPLDEMRGLPAKEDVPRTFVERLFGSGAATMLAVLICVSVFGAANPNLLSSPRAFYAMAQDGLLPRALVHVHRRWRTPTVAIWTQAGWAAFLVWFFQHFRDITEFVVFASLLFYALTVAAVYVLRVTRPDATRPYRCWGYPVSPAVFIAAVLAVEVLVLLDPANRTNALWGLLIIGAGIPVYLLVRARTATGPGARGTPS